VYRPSAAPGVNAQALRITSQLSDLDLAQELEKVQQHKETHMQ
jgi:hypothetical protein